MAPALAARGPGPGPHRVLGQKSQLEAGYGGVGTPSKPDEGEAGGPRQPGPATYPEKR